VPFLTDVLQAIARMEKIILEGRQLNGPPAAREVNAFLKSQNLEDQYVVDTYMLFSSVNSRIINYTLIRFI